MKPAASGPVRNAGPLIWGAVAAGCYMIVALLSFHAGIFPVRPLYDGLAPPLRYRWVNPPPETAFDNEPPDIGQGTLRLRPTGSEAGSVTTGDGQAAVVLPAGAVPPRAGESTVRIFIRPQDHERVVPEPIRRRFKSNPYEIVITYAASNDPVNLRRPVTVVIKYVVHASEIWRSDEPEWTLLRTTNAPANLQVFADTERLGTFVATSEPGWRPGLKAFLKQPWLVALAVVDSVVIVGIIAFVLWKGVQRLRAIRHARHQP